MLKNLSLVTLAALALALTRSVAAVPHSFDAREAQDVWDPPVIQPASGSVWKIGSQQLVTWNTTNPPPQITNTIGMVILAKNGLEYPNDPLASNFSITAGSVAVTVPHVKPGDDYQIVLFGDSGNFSPGTFSIVH